MSEKSSKSLIRIEKKKQKMAALLEVAKLNEVDRAQKLKPMTISKSDESEPSLKKPRIDIENVNNNLVLNSVTIELGPSGKPKLSGEEFVQLKKLLREKTEKMRAVPKFRLRDFGESAALSVEMDNRIPLFVTDIQHLLMYSQIGHHSPYNPARWCQLDKYNKLIGTNIFIIDNISLYHYVSHESMFPFLSTTYEHKLEIISPRGYNGDCVRELATIPLTSTQVRKFMGKFGSLEEAVLNSDNVFDLVKNSFPVEEVNNEEPSRNKIIHKGDKFPRTQLLLSGWQMVEENIPLPIKGLMERKYPGYVLTKEVYEKVTPTSPMFALDCEMCRTTTGDLELTRVSIVDEKLNTFYEQLVKPDNKIVDYLTKYSGITPNIMKPVTKKLKDIQEELRKLLPPDAILIGQSLNNDLHALKMMHPYIIDTSVIFNISGDRSRKTKLQTLSREFLSERIQEGRSGHCSIEDSAACMKLVKLKLSKSLYFGDAVMSNINLDVRKHPELGNANYATSMLKQTTTMEKNAYIVALDHITSKYMYFTNKVLPKKQDQKIVFLSKNSNSSVVKEVTHNMVKNSLNIAHIKISDNEYNKDNTDVFRNIDSWIKEMYDHSARPSLNIVLFGGHNDSGNGCCFIKLKT